MYRVIVRLGVGGLEKGFDDVTISLHHPNGAQLLQRIAKLPADLTLRHLCDRWQRLYRAYYLSLNYISYRLDIVESEDDPYHFDQADFQSCCAEFARQLNAWLATPDFAMAVTSILRRISSHFCCQWIIQSSDGEVQRLPWHLWSMFEDYPYSEVAMSLPEFELISPPQEHRSSTLNVLVILGKSMNDVGDKIDVQTDRRLIESISEVSARFVNRTSVAELRDLLSENHWDIILFAGHSSASHDQGQAGFLLDAEENNNLVTIKSMENAFQTAIRNGLKLVIFNSCESFELGIDLMRLNLPQCIAMGDAIPDAVAQRFLRYLIQNWHQGDDFVVAIRRARARLKENEEHVFPCASWLPVVCQNPAAAPPQWLFSSDSSAVAPNKDPRFSGGQRKSLSIRQLFGGGLGVFLAIVIMRSLGSLQGLELKAFDQFTQMSPTEAVDENILLITIDEADIQFQDQQKMPRRGSLSDVALGQLLEKLKPFQPRVISVDIFHDFPYEPAVEKIITGLPQFIAICEVGLSAEQAISIAPAAGLKPQQLAFSDMVLDPDERVRRQLLRMTPSEACPTDYGLGLRLAEAYLGETVQRSPQSGHLRLGNRPLPRLRWNSGGYRLPKQEAAGYQILTRYRHADFQQMSLREILSDIDRTKLQEWSQDSLIIIGLKQRSRDSLYTPLNAKDFQHKRSGLEVHAHMASQLIQSVESGRPLLWWWPEWLEFLWIASWGGLSLIGLYWLRQPLQVLCFLGALAAIVTLTCYILFLNGGWVPWVPVMIFFPLVLLGYSTRHFWSFQQPPISRSNQTFSID